MNLKEFQTDATKEAGVWVKFDDEGCEFLLASRNRPEFTRAYEKARKRLGFKRDTAEGNLACLRVAIGETCVLGWKNVTTDGTTPLDFTPAGVETLLKIPVLFDWIVLQVTDVSNFQTEATAEDAEALKSQS